MPPVETLPEDLRPLARRQAEELRDSRRDSDVEALIAELERLLAMERPPAQATPPGPRSIPTQAGQGDGPVRRNHAAWLGGALALIAAVFVAANLLRPLTTERDAEDAAARIETGPVPPSHKSAARNRLYTNRYSLSPRRGDAFPFAQDMGEAMLGFMRDNRHLLP